MNKSPIFLNGVPTEPDVIALTQAFGVPQEGVPISYADVAKVIHVTVVESRFKTVTSAWRKQLRINHDVILIARDGQFTVRAPSERVQLMRSKTRSGFRCFGEVLDINGGTDRARLSEHERAVADKAQRVASLGQAAALAEARRRLPPSPPAVAAAAG